MKQKARNRGRDQLREEETIWTLGEALMQASPRPDNPCVQARIGVERYSLDTYRRRSITFKLYRSADFELAQLCAEFRRRPNRDLLWPLISDPTVTPQN